MFLMQFLIQLLVYLCSASDVFSDRSVLVISLDGYGRDYLTKYPSSNIIKMMHAGSHPSIIRNQYPTLTFPNHFSMATGLYIESHGVVNNRFYDPDLDATLGVDDQPFFQQNKDAEPIWILNEEQGGVSACLMWPGCGFNYKNITESYHLPYDRRYSLHSVIDMVITLLDPVEKNTYHHYDADEAINVVLNDTLTASGNSTNVTDTNAWDSLIMKSDENRVPNLVMIYCSILDDTGHSYGPNSPEIITAIHQVDAELGHLMNELTRHQLQDNVDILLLSDHGMTEVQPSQVIQLPTIVDPEWYSVTGVSPMLHIYPKHDKHLVLYDELRSAAMKYPFSTVIKEKLPYSLHYRDNKRVAPIILQAEPGYVFGDFRTIMAARRRLGVNESRPYGEHGYSMDVSFEMEPILIAVGPSFKVNWRVPPASNVDVFPLLCSLLRLDAPPNNGSVQALELMMTTPPVLRKLNKYLAVLVGVVVSVVVLVGSVTAIYCWCRKPRHRHTRLYADPQDLISGYTYRANMNRSSGEPSAIMLSDDELSEEEKLLTNDTEVWEV